MLASSLSVGYLKPETADDVKSFIMNHYELVKRKILFDKISDDLSKPLRRFDTEIEYVPTQLICEYCKQNGADGIRFNSSLHRGGTNVVLFNGLDAECTSVLNREIKSVIIESK